MLLEKNIVYCGQIFAQPKKQRLLRPEIRSTPKKDHIVFLKTTFVEDHTAATKYLVCCINCHSNSGNEISTVVSDLVVLCPLFIKGSLHKPLYLMQKLFLHKRPVYSKSDTWSRFFIHFHDEPCLKEFKSEVVGR